MADADFEVSTLRYRLIEAGLLHPAREDGTTRRTPRLDVPVLRLDDTGRLWATRRLRGMTKIEYDRERQAFPEQEYYS